MRKLLALPYSPWSEKARWALDHHKVRYEEEAYLPMLGVPALRLRTRKLAGKVTVPVFFDGGAIFTDSLDIARHAESTGHGPRLFPESCLPEVLDWNERSEMACEAGRALVTSRLAQDTDALLETLPSAIPGALRGAMLPVARSGVSYFVRKYSLDTRSLQENEAKVREHLDAIRTGLKGGAHLVGGRFTYADIAMAVIVQMLVPVADRFLKIGPSTRRAWTHDRLAKDYADLVEWRDLLYGKYRKA